MVFITSETSVNIGLVRKAKAEFLAKHNSPIEDQKEETVRSGSKQKKVEYTVHQLL